MLDNALDIGIAEKDFWEMTIAELDRYAESKKRVDKVRAQEQASFDYLLACTIGRAFASSMDSKNKFPDIYEVYPSLFDREAREEQKADITMQLSALRFKQFAHAHNKKIKAVAI